MMIRNVYAEYLNNIGQLKVYLETNDGLDVDSVLINGGTLLYTSNNTQLPLFTLPNRDHHEIIDLKCISKDFYEIKISCTALVGSSHTSFADDNCFSYNMLKLSKNSAVSSISCVRCDAIVVEENKIKQNFDLPSADWLELRECWICHEDNYKEHTRQPIHAQQHVCLFGNTSYLIHENDMCNVDKDSSMKFVLGSCAQCKHLLGKFSRDAGFHFFKYAVNLNLTNNGNQDTISAPYFPLFLAHEIISLVRSQACFRYHISAYESNSPLLMLWVLNTDANVLLSNQSCSTEFSKMIKVGYRVLENGNASSSVNLWGKDKAPDTIYYPKVFCDELIRYLDSNFQKIPEHLNSIQDFRISFLPK